jgi:hypothetical protein
LQAESTPPPEMESSEEKSIEEKRPAFEYKPQGLHRELLTGCLMVAQKSDEACMRIREASSLREQVFLRRRSNSVSSAIAQCRQGPQEQILLGSDEGHNQEVLKVVRQVCWETRKSMARARGTETFTG